MQPIRRFAQALSAADNSNELGSETEACKGADFLTLHNISLPKCVHASMDQEREQVQINWCLSLMF